MAHLHRQAITCGRWPSCCASRALSLMMNLIWIGLCGVSLTISWGCNLRKPSNVVFIPEDEALLQERTFKIPRMTVWNFFRYFSVASHGRRLLAGLGLAAAVVTGPAHAQAYVNATVGAPPAVYVPRAPIYMYVPPGHAKHWAKHCARYAACGQPVYFLKEPPRRPDHFQGHRDRHEVRRHDDRREHWRDRSEEHTSELQSPLNLV